MSTKGNAGKTLLRMGFIEAKKRQALQCLKKFDLPDTNSETLRNAIRDIPSALTQEHVALLRRAFAISRECKASELIQSLGYLCAELPVMAATKAYPIVCDDEPVNTALPITEIWHRLKAENFQPLPRSAKALDTKLRALKIEPLQEKKGKKGRGNASLFSYEAVKSALSGNLSK